MLPADDDYMIQTTVVFVGITAAGGSGLGINTIIMVIITETPHVFETQVGQQLLKTHIAAVTMDPAVETGNVSSPWRQQG